MGRRRNVANRIAIIIGIVNFILCVFNYRIGYAGEGTTTAEFLMLFPGARSAAMADSYHASGKDSEALFANPAGILGLVNPQIGLSHMIWWQDIVYDSMWGVQPIDDSSMVGASIAWFRVSPFDSTEFGQMGTEEAWSLLTTLAYARSMTRSISLGGQVKWTYNRLSDFEAWGMAVDAGTNYSMLNDQLTLAIVIKNIGIQSAFSEQQNPLPLCGVLAAAFQMWPDDPNRLLTSIDITFPGYGEPSIAFGAEGWLENIVAIRAGVKSGQDDGNWLTLGAGVKMSAFHVDYALSPMGVLGMTHRMSLVYDFGSQRRLARPKLKVAIITKQFIYPDGTAGYTSHFIPDAHVAAGLTRWELSIKDRNGKIVKQFSDEKKMPFEIIWEGLDGKGNRINTESTYYYQMSVFDKQGYRADFDGEILPISITKLPKLKAMPRDIFAGQVSFDLKNAKNIQEWSIQIIGENGRVLKKYGGMGAVPKDFAWDGTDESNRQVAVKSGCHFILKVKDKNNNEMLSQAPLVVVDAGTKAYIESGEVLAEEVPFSFEPTDIKVKRWVFDIVDRKTQKVIRSYEGTSPLPETLTWDVKDESGKRVQSDRMYSYVLRMQDQIGNVWQQASDIKSTEIKVLERKSGSIRIKVEQILFDFNQAELKPNMYMKLRKIADFVNSNSKTEMKIYIEGHTDEVGTDAYNMELSIKRANMVMRYLVEDEKLPSSLMEMKGYGKTKPYIQGEITGRQAKNRRVEITLEIKEK